MRILTGIAAAALFAGPASASVVYSNNFDAENGGNSQLNYNGFNGLTVTDGTVDLIRSGDFGITCAGGTGSCVDLDGSTTNAGLTSSGSFAFAAGDRVALSFLFSGNQRGGASDTFRTAFTFAAATSGTYGFESTGLGNANLGAFNTGFLTLDIASVGPAFPMTDVTFFFLADNAGSLTFSFEDQGNDNVGIILDGVALDIGAAVPEPSAWALMILGFGAVGAAARRRRAVRATA